MGRRDPSDTLNEGRSLNSGDTAPRQQIVSLTPVRSTKAGV